MCIELRARDTDRLSDYYNIDTSSLNRQNFMAADISFTSGKKCKITSTQICEHKWPQK